MSTAPRAGILAGGNWTIDNVKMIDRFPNEGTLANIRSQCLSNGGAPYNVLRDLAQLQPGWPLQAVGLIGNDDYGQHIIDDCRRHGIDTTLLRFTDQSPTSYTDVMTVPQKGTRTFFHARGANALLTPEAFPVETIPARICHIGYLLLLDRLDEPDEQYGTTMGRLFDRLIRNDILTSLDVVSEHPARLQKLLLPTLPFVDYLIINEWEAANSVGRTVRNTGGSIDVRMLEEVARELLGYGVRRQVIIHAPEGGLALTHSEKLWQPSLRLPPDFIAATAGAGDAFCAGVLYALHEGWDNARMLNFGHALAAASLRSTTCSDGIKSLEETMELSTRLR